MKIRHDQFFKQCIDFGWLFINFSRIRLGLHGFASAIWLGLMRLHFRNNKIPGPFKGTVSRDFRPSDFSMNQSHLGHWSMG
jgi:hypothetical protein